MRTLPLVWVTNHRVTNGYSRHHGRSTLCECTYPQVIVVANHNPDGRAGILASPVHEAAQGLSICCAWVLLREQP